MSNGQGDRTPRKCRLAEVLQYTCEPEISDSGIAQYHCWPIPRIFRICQGRPAVEITRVVNIDIKSGEIDVPPEADLLLPKGKPWRDITHYENGHHES